MANGYPCVNEDGNPAALLITNLENGDTRALCLACAPADLHALADAIGGGLEQAQQPMDEDLPPETPTEPDGAPSTPESPPAGDDTTTAVPATTDPVTLPTE